MRRQLSILSGLLCMTFLPTSQSLACGGFFCQNDPIEQAGEQIIFHQEGSIVTAMVRILYQGAAEDFSWVVPVPSLPEISTGADATFDQLEVATRPRFFLERRGFECSGTGGGTDGSTADGTDGGTTGGGSAEDSGVIVEQTLSVGPFEIQIVSSDNSEDLAFWLVDNDYDLTDRGRELIEPYVLAGMKFVAVKLGSGESSGSIQPLIMKYEATQPTIPIRLTAIAAQEDMGVLVWVVNDARAVPENYLHVIPNYTHLNWYAGSGNAYSSYQSLITDAMNEAGGQGFATDLAGTIDGNITNLLTMPSELDQALQFLDTLNDAEFISNSLQVLFTPVPPVLLTAVEQLLPLPEGRNTAIYFDPFSLQTEFTTEQLASARTALRSVIVDTLIEPIRASVNLLPDGAYITRLYTTLSADEMTVDPTFTFNSNMPTQQSERNAILEARCLDSGTEWTLTLGSGTDRDGEVVIVGNSDVPSAAPDEVNQQTFTYRIETTSSDALPEVNSQAQYAPLQIGAADNKDDGFLGLGAAGFASLGFCLFLLFTRRRNSFLNRIGVRTPK